MKFEILFFILLFISNLNSQTTTNFISITSNSRIDIPAKEITLSLKIEKIDTVAQNAYLGLKEIEKKLIQLLKDYNIPDSNITYSLSQFHWSGGYNNRKIEFIASENVVIKIYDIKQYEPVQLALISMGIYSFQGIFSSTEIDEARKKGFKKAMEKAEKEAKLICSNIGRELGKVIEIESNNKDYVVNSGMEGAYTRVEETKLIDIPQYVTLNTNIRVKYELK